jgi:hypothetical protein
MTNKKTVFSFVVVCILGVVAAVLFRNTHYGIPEFENELPCNPREYFAYQSFLTKYVDTSTPSHLVDYEKLKTEESNLKAFMKDEIADQSVGCLSKKEQLAFYINAYNAGVLEGVLMNYPLETISGRDFYQKHSLVMAGKSISLEELSKKIYQGFREKRSLFSLACGTATCPNLAKNAYTEENIEESLDNAQRQYINNGRAVNMETVDAQMKVIVSEFFMWHEDELGDLNKYISKNIRADESLQDMVKSVSKDEWVVRFDWKLNDTK